MATQRKIVFSPSKDTVDQSNINALKNFIGLNSIEDLYSFSDNHIEEFYEYVVRHTGVWFTKPYTSIRDSSEGKEHTRWFTDGEINITYNCVERYKKSQNPAIKCVYEDSPIRVISFAQLDDITGRLAGSLNGLNIGKGDRVGIFMPMVPEAIFAMYAIMRIGAVAVPMFSGYGRDAVKTRVDDAGIRYIFTIDSYSRRGKKIKMASLISDIPGTQLITLHREGNEGLDFYELVEKGMYQKSLNTGSEDPAIMLYTSGTTGKPKGTIHVHGGSFVNLVKEMKYYMNFKEQDIIYWITDLGWMMGPWEIIGANALGGTVFLYPGAVDYPRSERVWDMVEQHGITILGLSPTFVRTMRARGIHRSFKSLKAIASTGEPWDKESWLYTFNVFGEGRLPICNVSGGTDIMGCFLASTPVTELEPNCLYRGLGMGVTVLDDMGNEIYDQIGHLVSREHLPSMTRGVWHNPERYIRSYWSRFPGYWSQEDWALQTTEGYFFLYGRADDVIKTSGKRVGPGEIENACSSVKGVVESAAIGVPDEKKGESIVVFYTGSDNEEVRKEMSQEIVSSLGKSFTPGKIYHVMGLPKTRSGKIMRRIIKKSLLGEDLGDISGLEDPTVVEGIEIIGRDQRKP